MPYCNQTKPYKKNEIDYWSVVQKKKRTDGSTGNYYPIPVRWGDSFFFVGLFYAFLNSCPLNEKKRQIHQSPMGKRKESRTEFAVCLTAQTFHWGKKKVCRRRHFRVGIPPPFDPHIRTAVGSAESMRTEMSSCRPTRVKGGYKERKKERKKFTILSVHLFFLFLSCCRSESVDDSGLYYIYCHSLWKEKKSVCY